MLYMVWKLVIKFYVFEIKIEINVFLLMFSYFFLVYIMSYFFYYNFIYRVNFLIIIKDLLFFLVIFFDKRSIVVRCD